MTQNTFIIVHDLCCVYDAVFQLLYFGADLERWAEFHAHSAHQVIRPEQHQRLAVYLLHGEVFYVFGASRQHLDEVAHLLHLGAQTKMAQKLTWRISKIHCSFCDS